MAISVDRFLMATFLTGGLLLGCTRQDPQTRGGPPEGSNSGSSGSGGYSEQSSAWVQGSAGAVTSSGADGRAGSGASAGVSHGHANAAGGDPASALPNGGNQTGGSPAGGTPSSGTSAVSLSTNGGTQSGGAAGAAYSGVEGGAVTIVGGAGGTSGSASVAGKAGSGVELRAGACFPEAPGTVTGRRGQVVVDSVGTSHMLYSGAKQADGSHPVRYGACASNCSSQGSWSFATIGEHGPWDRAVGLALGPNGQVHASWATSESRISGDSLLYATCYSGCTSVANWSSIPVVGVGISDWNVVIPLHASVDSQGHPRLLFSVSGTTKGLAYGACDANCGSRANWDITLISGANPVEAALAFAGLRPRVLYAVDASDGSRVVVYRECDSDCSNVSGWSEEQGYFYGGDHPNLRVTADGRPRILYNQANSGSSDASVRLDDYFSIYGWCEADCTAADSWSRIVLPMQYLDGTEGLSLALQPNDQPLVAYQNAGHEVALLACVGDCESTTGSWRFGIIDNSTLVATDRPAPLPICTSGAPSAFWHPGNAVDVALDSAGHAHLVYDSYVLESCNLATTASESLRLVRYAQL